MSDTTTKQYIVRFRRNSDQPPEEQRFNLPGPAFGFAYNIEINGGVALVCTVDRDEPLNSSQKMQKLEF